MHPTQPTKPANTVVITGASSGIGETFARRLAEQGYRLVLIARRKERLQELAQTLEGESAPGVEVIAADLSQADALASLADRLAKREDIALLVNNAGFGTMGDFVTIAAMTHEEMIRVHVLASARLCHSVLPQMLARGQGAIINVTSMAAFVIGPGQVTYASTKSFLKSFSESLHAEVAGQGVQVQALCPGFTRTSFHDTQAFQRFDRRQIPAHLWLTAEQVVDDSLRALKRRRPVCIPGAKYRWLARAMRWDFVRLLAGKRVRKRPIEPSPESGNAEKRDG